MLDLDDARSVAERHLDRLRQAGEDVVLDERHKRRRPKKKRQRPSRTFARTFDRVLGVFCLTLGVMFVYTFLSSTSVTVGDFQRLEVYPDSIWVRDGNKSLDIAISSASQTYWFNCYFWCDDYDVETFVSVLQVQGGPFVLWVEKGRHDVQGFSATNVHYAPEIGVKRVNNNRGWMPVLALMCLVCGLRLLIGKA